MLHRMPPTPTAGGGLGNVIFLSAQEEEMTPDLVEHIALSRPRGGMIKS